MFVFDVVRSTGSKRDPDMHGYNKKSLCVEPNMCNKNAACLGVFLALQIAASRLLPTARKALGEQLS
jgi:hypothetical protein